MKRRLLTVLLVVAVCSPAALPGTVTPVAAGTNGIRDAVLAAAAGDTIELTASGGLYHEWAATIIVDPLTIMAAAGLAEKPIWYCDSAYKIIDLRNDLTLEGIIFDGSLGALATSRGIRTPIDSVDCKWGYDLRVDNCDFINFTNAIRGEVLTQADTVIITNSYFAHMTAEAIRWKDGVPLGHHPPASVRYISVSYSTFYDVVDEAVYVDDHDNVTATEGPVIILDHLTLNKCGSKALYPHTSDGTVIKNVIVANSSTGEYALRLYGANSVLENVLYYNCPSGISKKDGFTYDSGEVLAEQNPYFETDSTFAVAAGSPAAVFAVGDTNNGTWDAAANTSWEFVANDDWYNRIKGALTNHDTLVFATSGGSYYTSGTVALPATREYVLMAKPGLAAKPVLSNAYGKSYLLMPHAQVVIRGLRFEGDGMLSHPDSVDGSNTNYLVAFEDESNDYGTTVIEDCEFWGAKLRAIHTYDTNTFDTLIVNNCLFEEIGETGVYNSNATSVIDVARITNCTFSRFGQKGVYLKGVGDLEVSHCTFFYSDSTLSGRNNGSGVSLKEDTVLVVRDNIFANLEGTAVKMYGPSPTVEYNMFWEVGKTIENQTDTLMTFPTFNFDSDPLFKDTSAAALDLALNVNGDAIGAASDESNLGDTTWGTWGFVSVDERGALPIVYALHQNYPNPFNPSTTIKFDVAVSGHVKLTVYNILGQEVATLVDQYMEPGFHSMYWNAGRLASGIYFYRIKVNEFVKNQKLVILK